MFNISELTTRTLALVKGEVDYYISQVQVESLRQELSEKQSLLSEAGEAIEQLENKIKLQDDLNKKVKRNVQFN